MPDFSLRLPRFLRFHRSQRSHSPKSIPASSCCDAAASQPPYLGPSPALSSHPSATCGAVKQVDYAAIDRLCADRTVPGDSNSQPVLISRPITPINAVNADSASDCCLQDSATRPTVHLPQAFDPTDSIQSHHSFAMPLQQPVVLEQQSQPSGEHLQPPRRQNQEMFTNAHNFTVTESKFIENSICNVTLTNNFSNSNFMKDLLKETIPGAAADSSARDPPPRCHPGTRIAILGRCLYFIAHCNGVKKMRWVVGAAGVGKSAVMQNVVESPQLQVSSNASVFFSINGRSDGTKAIMTLSYQFAAKSHLYRRLIEEQVSRDPQLFQTSMSTQFENFIVQPFIHSPDLNTASRVLIVIDGLDECNDIRTQVELLRLISTFCTSYPSSPIAWLIASRPESHITSFFSRPEVIPTYEKEDIAVDSDEACADVERYLRYELSEIGKASDFLGPQWPDEQHLWKLASAAGGLFAYAYTAVRYVGDSSTGDPVSQLSDVLNVIDELPLHELPQDRHPMALLDALYARILFNVPSKLMINARKLLLLLASNWDQALDSRSELIVMCNWLGMTADEAYAALNRLRSVLEFPPRHEAHKKMLRPFHKSFIDHLFRSEFSSNIQLEAQEIKIRCAFRVLEEAPDGIDVGNMEYKFHYGEVTRNRGSYNQVSITWPADKELDWNDDKTRLSLYQLAIGEVVAGMKRSDPVFQSGSCIRLLTTRFERYNNYNFPCRELCDFVFDRSRSHELMKEDILKQIPAKAISASDVSNLFDAKLQFYRPVTTMTRPDPWNSSCKHERVGQWEPEQEKGWTTTFSLRSCEFCFERLQHQLETLIDQHPDYATSIMFTSEIRSCVQIRFVDSKDSVAEWTYWLWICYTPEERKGLGSTI